jgi:hypothetical protein
LTTSGPGALPEGRQPSQWLSVKTVPMRPTTKRICGSDTQEALAQPSATPRHAAGTTKWNYRRLWTLSLEGITSFTTLPLKFATWLGLATAAAALLYGGWVVAKALLFGDPVPGYPSLMTVVLLLGGVQLLTLGVIGEYLGRIFNETKGRPLYIVGRHLPSGGDGALPAE